jgi:hypothetical protein
MVQHILSYLGCGPEYPVTTMYCSITLKFSYMSSDKTVLVVGEATLGFIMRIHLCATVLVVRESKLGFIIISTTNPPFFFLLRLIGI